MNDTQQGFTLELDLLGMRITTLSELTELTGDLVATATRLAERLPLLGTAPPAVHLAMRLREAAGETGLAGEVAATQREVREFEEMLGKAKARYQDQESEGAEELRRADADEPDDARGRTP